jgi:hypothetical protein
MDTGVNFNGVGISDISIYDASIIKLTTEPKVIWNLRGVKYVHLQNMKS